MTGNPKRSTVLPRLSSKRFEITDTALRVHVKRLAVAGIPPPEIADMLGRSKEHITRITKDPVFAKSVLDTLEAINKPIDQQQVQTLRELRQAINEEAPRSFETLVQMAYATTPDELEACGLDKPLTGAQKAAIHQSIVDRHREGTAPKKIEADLRASWIIPPQVAEAVREVISERQIEAPTVDVTPEAE